MKRTSHPTFHVICSKFSSIERKQMNILNDQKIEEIRKDPNNQDWCEISYNYKLSESFIREFKESVDWRCISKYQTLSESFIEEFKDKVMWSSISWRQTLSEPFIREFKDKVWWSSISPCQILSEDFIYEFIDRVNIEYILKYQTHLSTGTRNKIKVIYELKK